MQFAWEQFLEKSVKQGVNVVDIFPFNEYFYDLPDMFKGQYEEDMEVAHSAWRHIQNIFEQLEEFRAFELLRNGRDRTEYLLVSYFFL